jgi:hypothetical protein
MAHFKKVTLARNIRKCRDPNAKSVTTWRPVFRGDELFLRTNDEHEEVRAFVDVG